jgi:hypothetical protein
MRIPVALDDAFAWVAKLGSIIERAIGSSSSCHYYHHHYHIVDLQITLE